MGRLTGLLVAVGALGPAAAALAAVRAQGDAQGLATSVSGPGGQPVDAVDASASSGAASGVRMDSEQDSEPLAEPEAAGVWRVQVTLQAGDRLDLATGRVQTAGEEPAAGYLELTPSGGKVPSPPQELGPHGLLGTATLARLRARPDGGVTDEYVRPPSPEPTPPQQDGPPRSLDVGAEFRVHTIKGLPDRWGYLRVVDVASQSAKLEYALFGASTAEFQRDPVSLAAAGEASGHRITWESGPGARGEEPSFYRVRRRVLDDEGSGWETLATVDGRSYFDAAAPGFHASEYEVVQVNADGDRPAGLIGGIVRAARIHTPGDWPLEVAPGARVDLLAGKVVPASEPAHIEVSRSSPGSFAVRPLGSTRLSGSGRAGKKPTSWWLVPADHVSFASGKAAAIRTGEELMVRLPGDLLGRISVESAGGERWLLRRDISLEGHRLVPRAFAAAPHVDRGGSGTLIVTGDAPGRETGANPRHVALVVEREEPFGLGSWRVVGVSKPGGPKVLLEDPFGPLPPESGVEDTGSIPGAAPALDRPPSLPIVRLRVRHQLRDGRQSAPGPSIDLLEAGADPGARDLALEQALASLDDEDFQLRLQARGVLVALGDDARDALKALTLDSSLERRTAASDVLAVIDSLGDEGQLGLERLGRRGLELAASSPMRMASGEDPATWLGEVPEALARGDAPARAHALLLLVDRSERGVADPGGQSDVRVDVERARIWTEAVASVDADPGLRWLARYVADLESMPSMAAFEPPAPYYLMDPEARSSTLDFGASWAELPGASEQLAWQLETRNELGDLDLGPPLAQLLHRLRDRIGAPGPGAPDPGEPVDGSGWEAGGGAAGEARFFDYDVRTAELVLRLMERARRAEEPGPLLEAAAALVAVPGGTLHALREVSDRRLASPSAATVSRERIELEDPSLRELEALIGSLNEFPGAGPVDIVLPPGRYYEAGESEARFLDIERGGLRLMAASPSQPPEIHAGIRVRRVGDIVLENVRIVHRGGPALSILEGAAAICVGARLSGTATVVQVQKGDVELYECTIDAADLARPPQWAVRQLGPCRLLARATLFRAGTVFLSDDGEAFLDRCVVDAGSRTLIQAQRSGALEARESLFRGEGLGLYNIQSGVLAACVLDVARDPFGQRASGLRIAPRSFRLIREGQQVPDEMRLGADPLGGR